MTQDTSAQRLGASESQYEKEKGASGGKFLKIIEGPNVHRIVKGFTVSNQVFLPTVIENEAGELEQTTRVIDVPKSNAGFYDTLIGKMINASWAVQKKYKLDWSPLNVSRRGAAVVFDINEDMEDNETDIPTLQIASYPISVIKDDRNKTGLLYLQKQQTLTPPFKLVNGPMFAWNAVITKNVDGSKSNVRGTSYSVRVMTEDEVYMTFANKLPLNALDADWDGYDKLFDQVYTPEQREAIEVTFEEKHEAMKNTYNPVTTNQAMLEFFEEFPLDLTAKDSEDEPKFPHAEELVKTFENLDIKMIEGSTAVANTEHQITDGSEEEQTEDNTEEAEHEVVEEEKETVVAEEKGW